MRTGPENPGVPFALNERRLLGRRIIVVSAKGTWWGFFRKQAGIKASKETKPSAAPSGAREGLK